MLFLIRNALSPVASDRSKISSLEIGHSGKIDFKDNTNKSLLGDGQSLLQRDIYRIISSHINNLPIQGWFIVPFCENIKDAMKGINCGYYQFNTSSDQLSLFFGAAPHKK